MPEKKHSVRLEQIGAAAFEATAFQGDEPAGSLIIDGSPDIGGEGRGMRPMEVLLASLASCSAMDVVHILRKQRQTVEKLTIEIEGTRKDATPSPYKSIKLVFTAHGNVENDKLQRAVSLAVEKYCSVRTSLDPEIEITWEARHGTGAA